MRPNDALHTDSAPTLKYYVGDHWRGDGEGASFDGARVMKYCEYCGRDNEDEAVYCRECGTQEFKKQVTRGVEESERSEAVESPKSEFVAPDTPTRCEWCGRENAAGTVNCHECGTSLLRRKARPKIPSKAAEPEPVRWKFRTLTPNEMKLDLVTLLTCRSIVEADLVVGELESIGIPAFIPDEFVAQAMAWNINGFGYVRVQVSPADYERAKDFMSESSKRAELGTAPNGGPASSEGTSTGGEGPP